MLANLLYILKRNLQIIKLKWFGGNHWHEFIDAVRGAGPKPSANFEYSGPLSETVLLGGIATRFKDETLFWDAPSLSFKGNKKATELVSRKYRKGQVEDLANSSEFEFCNRWIVIR